MSLDERASRDRHSETMKLEWWFRGNKVGSGGGGFREAPSFILTVYGLSWCEVCEVRRANAYAA